MRLYFGGGEIKAWRDLFEAEGVTDVALSFFGLSRRVKRLAEWKISDHIPFGTNVFLDSGAYTFNRDDSEHDLNEARKIAETYKDFVLNNVDAVSLVSEFDAQVLGLDAIESAREEFYATLPADKFMPIWHAEYGVDYLESLANSFHIVGITQTEVGDKDLIPLLNGLVSRYGTRLHGVGITGRDIMKQVKWDSVSSMSWLSPSVYEDTIIWIDKTKTLKRYPRAYKTARKQHRTLIADAGFNPELIEEGNSNELLRLSLWSWQQFVASLSGRVTNVKVEGFDDLAENSGVGVDTQGTHNGNGKLVPVVRETTVLPIMRVRFGKDEDAENPSDIPFLYKRSESMRACNTCFLKEKCPGFKPSANCLYNIPIEIKTTAQRKALQSALVEMQTQRVLFMQMAEDLEGGYADPHLSSEIDRLQRMIKAQADSEREGTYLKVEAYSTEKRAGFIEKVFGPDTAAKINAIEPVKADDLIKESEIFEADVVG